MTTLVLDAGDLFGNRTKKDMMQSEFLAECTAKFATTPSVSASAT